MCNEDKIVIVVDAYSTGKYLPTEIMNRGYSWIHIISRNSMPSSIVSDVKHHSPLHEIYYQGDFLSLIKNIEKYNIAAVMAGTETAIELAERIAHSLGLPGNNPETSNLRRNKYDMVEAVRKSGLHTANQYISDNVENIVKWYQENFNKNDLIVIKPLNSAGTDHVIFCSSVKELRLATKKILGNTNKLGLMNEFVLGQSFLQGDEYVVNTVSVDGMHHLTDIWQCQKQRVKGAGYVPGCEILLPSQGERQNQLKNYAFKSLDALGIKQGPAHFEIMFTENGPAIIEVGARIQGGVNPNVHLACMGTSQLIKSVDSYLDHNKFFSYLHSSYSLKKYSRWVDLIVPKSGVVKSFKLLEEAKKLPSFFSANVSIKQGCFLPKTVDLFTSPGDIYLINENSKQLEDDYETLRSFEKDSYDFI